MSQIKAIQTEYNGYLFRSRLEARWAVFFDACGIEWEYEPEGFELENGTYYLPDFLLHDVMTRYGCRDLSDVYVEVKPRGRYTEEDAEKVCLFELPIICVGEIPDPYNYVESCEDQRNRYCGEMRDRYGCAFCPWDYGSLDGDRCFWFSLGCTDGHLSFHGADSSYDYGYTHSKIVDAFKAARQARFEHGETPQIRR